jgi:hypothetical protein
MRKDIRFWTAIVLIGICGFAVARGWSVVRFSLAADSMKNPTEIAQAWSSTPGVASTALETEVRDKIDPSDLTAANNRREQLSAILSIKPLSSYDWLSLSGMLLVTEEPMEQVLESLELSVLTGPNEGYVMAERGIFGVSLWESLSPDLKNRAAMDLAMARIAVQGDVREKLRAVLSTKTEQVRSELEKALLATGVSPKEIEQRLGF